MVQLLHFIKCTLNPQSLSISVVESFEININGLCAKIDITQILSCVKWVCFWLRLYQVGI